MEDDKKPGSATVRLNKFLSMTGICSRRKADDLIFAGSVTVNGKIEKSPGYQIGPRDKVSVNGKSVYLSNIKVYIALNKPPQLVTTRHDPQGRNTVFDCLPNFLKEKNIFPIGRLDYFSEGLLLFTNDGELANRLMHPRYEHEKIYEVKIRGKVEKSKMDKFASGIVLPDGTKFLPIEIIRENYNEQDTTLTLKLREGKNREIRKICESLNLTILYLKRIAIANIRLGNLKKGQWRKLGAKEVAALKALIV